MAQIEIEVVHIAGPQMELSLDLRDKLLMVFFQIGRQIIVVMPIGDDVFIDLTADRIIGIERITVFPARREDRLIDAILSHAMGQVTADGQLIVMFIAHRP